MPLYEYECDACGHRFELIRKFSDPPLEACPKCGGAVRKLTSSPAFQFKGTGWYVTDYARKDQGGAAASKSGESKKESSGGEASSKSESKPASESSSSTSSAPKTDASKS